MAIEQLLVCSTQEPWPWMVHQFHKSGLAIDPSFSYGPSGTRPFLAWVCETHAGRSLGCKRLSLDLPTRECRSPLQTLSTILGHSFSSLPLPAIPSIAILNALQPLQERQTSGPSSSTFFLLAPNSVRVCAVCFDIGTCVKGRFATASAYLPTHSLPTLVLGFPRV